MNLVPPKSGPQLLDLYYLELRSHLLEAAAILDRLERAGLTADPKLNRLLDAGRVLHDGEAERARRLQERLSL